MFFLHFRQEAMALFKPFGLGILFQKKLDELPQDFSFPSEFCLKFKI